ncbi:chlorinating enzyme [Sphingomonas sp. CBMAI 2297]|uniref:chlorinating enzyme n=1 Tax=Sphingomonas sp. CBMAI 2297 TaxID=2991720 RepID=UPI002453DDF0|nr:chlorinating enzyme [Sphingomonas sp. CBMAI 2297]MDH4746231.1 chlorinating enzyme [Sphingomonas sp. CBMAI 2297]
MSLSEREIAQFDRDGFIGPFDVYPREEMLARLPDLRLSLLDRDAAAYALGQAGPIANYDRHLDVAFLEAHVRRPEIVARLRSILGDDLLCWRTEFFAKYPGDEGTDWHQSRNLAIGDGIPQLAATEPHARYPEIFLTLTVWTAFTDATIENGCMQYVPGSHRHVHFDDLRPMRWDAERINRRLRDGVLRGLYGYDTRELQVDADWDTSRCEPVTVEMRAGQCMISWEATMHGSLPNTTREKTRMAFVARYVPTNVRIYPTQSHLNEYGGTADLGNWRALLVSGTDRYGYNRVRAGLPA